MKKTILVIAAVTSLMASCAMLAPSVYVNNPGRQKVSLKGKSLAILPFEIKYQSTRLAIDLRNIKITINGREAIIQNKYIVKDDSDDIGEFGVLDLNILDKEKVSREKISLAVTRSLLNAAEQKTQYQIAFMRGLGFGEFGWLTSGPMNKNEQTRQLEFDSAYVPESFFSKVEIIEPEEKNKLAGFDYILNGSFNIDNELIQVITGRPPRYMDDPVVIPGEYYIRLVPNLDLTIIDNRTGKEVMKDTDINKSQYPMKMDFNPYKKLPIKARDGAAYAAFMASDKAAEFVADHLENNLEQYYQLFLPYNVVTTEPATEK